MKNRRLILFTIGVVLLIVFAYAYNALYHGHRQIQKEKARFSLAARTLHDSMSRGDNARQYLDQVVQTSGMITSLDQSYLTLDHCVQVRLTGPGMEVAEGDRITVKGRCVGYDDLLEMVRLDQANIVHENQPK